MKKFLILILFTLSNCNKNTFSNLNSRNKNNEKLAIVIGQTGGSYEVDVKINEFNNLDLGMKQCIFKNIGGKKELIGIREIYKTEEGLLDIYIGHCNKNKKYVVGEFKFEDKKLRFDNKKIINFENALLDDYDEKFPNSQQVINNPGLVKRLCGQKHYYIRTGNINYNNFKFTFYDTINEAVKNDCNEMEKNLRYEGFDVILALDKSTNDTKSLINYFKNQEVSEKLFYYSGHGFSHECKEYMELNNDEEMEIPLPSEFNCRKLVYLLDKCSSFKKKTIKSKCSPQNEHNKDVIYLKAAYRGLKAYCEKNGFFTESLLKGNNLNLIFNSKPGEELEKHLEKINNDYILIQVRYGVENVSFIGIK